jgi:hypothetical protein
LSTSDEVAITNLLYGYAELIDAGRFDIKAVSR